MFLRKKQLGIALVVLGACCTAYAYGNPNENSGQSAVSSQTTDGPAVRSDSNDKAMLQRGQIVWMRCRTCHEAPSFVGPRLDGVFGAAAGSRPGYVYSNPLKDSGIVWDAQTLDQFIKHPAEKVPGTRMEFPGIANETDRNALIHYLKTKFKTK